MSDLRWLPPGVSDIEWQRFLLLLEQGDYWSALGKTLSYVIQLAILAYWPLMLLLRMVVAAGDSLDAKRRHRACMSGTCPLGHPPGPHPTYQQWVAENPDLDPFLWDKIERAAREWKVPPKRPAYEPPPSAHPHPPLPDGASRDEIMARIEEIRRRLDDGMT